MNSVRTLPLLAIGAMFVAATTASAGDFVTYSNESSVRMITNDDAVGTADTQEKDFDWADVDQDGDLDLVVVRKVPFTSSGGLRNVLFMNEGISDGHAIDGVLVDQTTAFIPDFLDLTNDRDVQIADLDGDGWLDIVTCTTLGGLGNPKSITHPRIYINQGDDVGGNWLGYVYDDVDRIPSFQFEPRFCGVAVGDIDNDGDLDLYFVDYASGPYLRGGDLDDRLLTNDGNGFFTDESALRMTPAMLESGFGTNCEIIDMNGDGWKDIVKSENGPIKTINNGGNGFFNIIETTYTGSAYHMTTADLNNDGLLDIVASDDGTDRYLLNTGNGPNGMADFSSHLFPVSTGGFGSNSYEFDLDNDGWRDVIIADVDVDAPGCSRITDILHNLGNAPNVSFTTDSGNIPSSQLTGVHDIGVFDLNGDGLLDMVMGRCAGTQLWINAPSVAISFAYPLGLPDMLAPDAETVFQVQLNPIGDTLDPGSERLYHSRNDGDFVATAMTPMGGGLYEATIPEGACADRFDFYIGARLTGGLSFFDPPAAPASSYAAVVSAGEEIFFTDNLEGDVSAWTVTNHPSLSSGAWELADPNGTFSEQNPVAPGHDATADPGVMAFVTQNGLEKEPIGASDVDGGPTMLTSPVIDLAAADGFVSYSYWLVTLFDIHDTLLVEVTNDGTNWTSVTSHVESVADWERHIFLVGDFVEPTTTVQVRFSVLDTDNSVTEAGIDDFQVSNLCLDSCPWDLDGDAAIAIADLLSLLALWGMNPGGPPDFDGDGTVAIADLLQLLANWGPCP